MTYLNLNMNLKTFTSKSQRDSTGWFRQGLDSLEFVASFAFYQHLNNTVLPCGGIPVEKVKLVTEIRIGFQFRNFLRRHVDMCFDPCQMALPVTQEETLFEAREAVGICRLDTISYNRMAIGAETIYSSL
jgi:hypothetical protein